MKKITTLLLALFAVLIFATSCDKDPVTPEPLNVLVIGSESDKEWIVDVRNKIDGTDLFATVDTFNMIKRVPSLELLNSYDAVLVFTDSDPYNAVTTGDNLAAYIEAGGGVVNAVFSGSYPITGNFTKYSILTNSDDISGVVRTLGTVADSDHLIMENIVSFNGGTASYINTDGIINENATVIAKYDNDVPLVIIQENVGPKSVNRVFLNFFPPSKDVREDFWDPSTDGDLLMAYALIWSAQ